MLNLTEIAARLKQPELCGASDIDSLRTLCETYPYSQIFPLLYLKTLAQTNDVRLDNELQKYAYRISDRIVLFDLLNDKKEREIEVEETIEEEVIVSSPLTPPQEEQLSLPEESGEKLSISSDLPSLPDDVLKSLSIGTEVYSLEAEEAIISAQKEKEKQEQLQKEKEKLIEALAQKKSPTEEKAISERTFTSWLKHNSSHVQQVEEKPNPELLIERFIQNDPKISAKKEQLFEDRTDKNELFNPIKKAKESLDETQLPVSETLAKIFAAQGNYPKAIYAYQQLMLIFPEKKVFFASQIEDLNKKLNT
jgi:hypothetical protein